MGSWGNYVRLWGGEGRIAGCVWASVGVCLGERRGVSGGASGCGWGAPASIWGADGSEVLFFSQVGPKSYVFAGGKKFGWKRMTGQRVFVAMLDALRVTPV